MIFRSGNGIHEVTGWDGASTPYRQSRGYANDGFPWQTQDAAGIARTF